MELATRTAKASDNPTSTAYVHTYMLNCTRSNFQKLSAFGPATSAVHNLIATYRHDLFLSFDLIPRKHTSH
jgi:hypothetical protein